MSNIVEVENLITQDEATEIVNQYFSDLPYGETELMITDDPKFDYLKKLLPRLQPHINEYAKNSGIKRELFYKKIFFVKQKSNSDQVDSYPLHFDESVSEIEGDLCMSPFASLLYLISTETDFTGGQLMFPFQQKIIEPKVGKIVLLPTGYIYSHKVLPFFGGTRYVIKIFQMFKSQLPSDDRERLGKRIKVKDIRAYD